jgi:hypothetical protein
LLQCILIVFDWCEKFEIFNTMIFIKCNYEVAE